MRCMKIALKFQDLKVASFWSLILYLVSFSKGIFILDQDCILMMFFVINVIILWLA
jgi:hypothetical protein